MEPVHVLRSQKTVSAFKDGSPGAPEPAFPSGWLLLRQLVVTGWPASSQTILKVAKRLRETGCVTSRPRVRRHRNVRCKVQPEDVLAYALAHPQSSTKMISENCGLSKSRVWKILNESGAHPYRSTPVQGLPPSDAERR
ncbi:hypothetical protein AVEN_17605-1 [Araneus ventricosus]|uniref:Transposase Tc1-like domain-containing protein n=1 Tax=Araneus ventricosus TaxID=182803 RepID=A0A4Y2LB36_ARAVE|nr:hypothetical protein AVEN_17605-1 [Araneus ventricosus]